MTTPHRARALVLLALLLLATLPFAAQDDLPQADIVNDEGGPVLVQGLMAYTSPFFTLGVAQPLVLLEDQAGFVARDLDFVFPPESQVLGNFTSDYFESPVSYNINLPIAPAGTLVDVDNNDSEDIGLMVYTPAYWTNKFGDPFLEKRDIGGGGWSGAYAGTIVQPDTLEVTGGKLIIYAPEEGQGFPSSFGEDGLLFTEDDPIVIVPQGWTTVELAEDAFIFDRSATAEIDLLEPDTATAIDYSDLSYTEAFDAAIELLRTEYSFTEYKNVDWDALNEEIRPRIVEAEENEDATAYKRALRDLTWSIPDGHVGAFGAGMSELNGDFIEATEGGLGFNIAELEDGRVVVEFVLEGSPADAARIEPGDEIIAIGGMPIQTALNDVVVYAAPFSTIHNLRVQQLRYVVRYPAGTEVDVTFINSSTNELSTVTLAAAAERATWSRTSILAGAPQFTGPVEYELLPEGYGYVQITTFSGNTVLSIQDWENFMNLVNNQNIPGIVIDMRYNGGGLGSLATGLAGYFFEEETIVGYSALFNDETGEFYVETDAPRRVFPAPEEFRYRGEIAVLVGPACASACEFFSDAVANLDNVAIIGEYPSAGLGGSINDFDMPEDVTIRYTQSRGLDENQKSTSRGSALCRTLRSPSPWTQSSLKKTTSFRLRLLTLMRPSPSRPPTPVNLLSVIAPRAPSQQASACATP
ncbi:MAG: S41 family peptidase [Chloroflexota bacterium]